MQDTSGAVVNLQNHDDGHEDTTVANQQTRDLIKGLMNEGFKIKILFSKASFHQAKIESITKLDGVGPVDNRHSINKLYHFVREKKNDM